MTLAEAIHAHAVALSVAERTWVALTLAERAVSLARERGGDLTAAQDAALLARRARTQAEAEFRAAREQLDKVESHAKSNRAHASAEQQANRLVVASPVRVVSPAHSNGTTATLRGT